METIQPIVPQPGNGIFEKFLGKDDLNPVELEIIDEIESRLTERYGGENKVEFPFHNIEHSVRITLLARHIIETIKEISPELVEESDEKAVKIAPAGHDLIIRMASGVANGQLFRFRGTDPETLLAVMKGPFSPLKDTPPEILEKMAEEMKGNEGASAEEVLDIIKSVDTEGYYDDETLGKITKTILATYPGVEVKPLPESAWKPPARYLGNGGVALRFYQPEIFDKKDSTKHRTDTSLSELALAWADLTYLGAIRPANDPMRKDNEFLASLPTYKDVGNAEYRETRQRLGYRIVNSDIGIDKFEIAELKSTVKDMVNWLKAQVQFASWQKVNLEEMFRTNNKLKDNPKVTEALSKDVFPNVMANIEDSMERYDSFVPADKNTGEEVDAWISEMTESDLRDLAKKLATDFGY